MYCVHPSSHISVYATIYIVYCILHIISVQENSACLIPQILTSLSKQYQGQVIDKGPTNIVEATTSTLTNLSSFAYFTSGKTQGHNVI